jgi:antitoxin HicB
VSERLEARYPAVLEPRENGALLVRSVDLEDTFTEGATPDEAPFNGAEVLSAMLRCRLDRDLPIPDPSPAGEGMVLIAPDARTQAALLIRRARGERSLAELARSLETSWPSAQRLENPRHSPTLRQLEKAAAACKRRICSFPKPWPRPPARPGCRHGAGVALAFGRFRARRARRSNHRKRTPLAVWTI